MVSEFPLLLYFCQKGKGEKSNKICYFPTCKIFANNLLIISGVCLLKTKLYKKLEDLELESTAEF